MKLSKLALATAALACLAGVGTPASAQRWHHHYWHHHYWHHHYYHPYNHHFYHHRYWHHRHYR